MTFDDHAMRLAHQEGRAAAQAGLGDLDIASRVFATRDEAIAFRAGFQGEQRRIVHNKAINAARAAKSETGLIHRLLGSWRR